MDSASDKFHTSYIFKRASSYKPFGKTIAVKTQVYALEAVNGAFVKHEVDIDQPAANEVLVEVVASGICHSDLNVVHGTSPTAFPIVLGHEGTGYVREVGSAITTVKPGDKVILCWCHCNTCDQCLEGKKSTCDNWFSWNLLGNRTNGQKTWTANGKGYGNFLSQGSFAKHLLIEESGVIKVDDNADLVKLAAGVGCGVMTGSGTVFNAFHGSRVGASIAVFGVGAVGAGAIMAARNGHYSKIIAIDLFDNRLEIAKQLGATHTISGKEADVPGLIQQLGGVDYSVECTGVPKVLETAYQSLRKGGTVAVVGIAPFDKTFALPISMHMSMGKKIVGVSLGNAYPKLFLPFLIDLANQGRLPVETLSKQFPMEKINEAVAAMKDGSVIKPVVVW